VSNYSQWIFLWEYEKFTIQLGGNEMKHYFFISMCFVSIAGVLWADPFFNPPELTHPDWTTPFPYQRNIMVGFDTDPHDWPDHITSPTPDARKALTPSVVHHEGTDDSLLYPSDWLGGDVQPPEGGYTSWLDTDTVTGTDRQGILAMNATNAYTTFTLTWHIDNWDRIWEEKHFFVEAEYYTSGNIGLDELISSSGRIELTPHYESLSDGWVRWSSWATLKPNPEWEEMVNTITFEAPGVLLLDYMHIATECVPEPITILLLCLGSIFIRKRRG
jgi:hypothetical protein